MNPSYSTPRGTSAHRIPLLVSASILLLVVTSTAEQAPGAPAVAPVQPAVSSQSSPVEQTGAAQPSAPVAGAPQVRPAALAPTAHPAVPGESSQFWLAPDRAAWGQKAADTALGTAVRLEAAGEYTKALDAASQPGARQGVLGVYATYYAGVAQLRLNRAAQARTTFQGVRAQKPVGYLAEAAALGEAEAAETLSDAAAAVSIYEQLLAGKPISVEDLLMRLGRAAKMAGQLEKAGAAYMRVYYEFPLSEVSPQAYTELTALPDAVSLAGRPDRFTLDLARAERFFSARQYAIARTAFEGLRVSSSGDDRDLIDLRLAECDQLLKRALRARDGLKKFVDSGPRQAEALHYYALASRDVGDRQEFARSVRRLVDEFPTDAWADEALNALAGFYVVKDEDEQADALFRELCEKYPRSRHAERAAWKVGWRAYRDGAYAEAARFFEQGAADFPRSDYRPAWLYWSARAHEQLQETAVAQDRYALVAADYQNTYYGRLGQAHFSGSPAARVLVARTAAAGSTGRAQTGQDVVLSPALPPNAAIIRALLGIALYDEALTELRYAQKTWGDTPPIQATIAWIYSQQARTESGGRRFQLLRGAITGMRRAYPQFLAAGGEDLPRELLTVIFPMAYWDLIRRYSAEYELDPYFVAALVAQESTFVADIRSKANAVGLMQLMPATARSYARKLSIRYTPQLSTDPEANIRMGTAYLADKLKEFGDLHLALASYNAGERPVRRWIGERSGLDRDEFIDDIPYPETQNYVKRILGTADDYRRLYGADKVQSDSADTVMPVPVSTSSAAPRKPATSGSSSQTRPSAPKRPTKARKAA